MKRVLFVSYNKHQRIFFNEIVRSKSNDNSVYDHVFLGKSWCRFLEKITVFSDVVMSKEKLNRVCSYEKAMIFSKQKRYPNIRITVCEKIAKRLYGYFLRYLRSENCDMVIVWNGSRLISAAALEAAKELGIKVLVMENGYFPNTIVMDPKGVNAESSLFGKSAESYLQVKIDYEKYKDFLRNGINKRALKKTTHDYDEEKINKEKEYIFLPFQVHDDTQIIVNSPYIKKMEKLLELVYENIEKYNYEHNSNFWIAVKEHPSDYGRIDYSELFKNYTNKNVFFYKKANTDQLIKNSKLVVTINSSVGLESLFRDKPVITLGNAFYNIDGIVRNVKSEQEFYEKLCDSLEEEVNKELNEKFLYYLRFHYLVEAKKPAHNQEDVVNVINRIEAYL